MHNQEEAFLFDWGNSALRIHRMQKGEIVEQRIISNGGVSSVIDAFGLHISPELAALAEQSKTDGKVLLEYERLKSAHDRKKGEAFASTTVGHIGDWLRGSPNAPIILCGHVGSGQGWSFAAHNQCPIDLGGYSQNLHAIPKEHLGELRERSIHIVQGFKYRAPSTPEEMVGPDGKKYMIKGGPEAILRGEDVKTIGVYELLKGARNLVCMPGTHPQWAVIENAQVTGFMASIGGEMYKRMFAKDSVLHDLLQTPCDDPDEIWRSFLHGVKLAKDGVGTLMGIFNVRANAIAGLNPQPSPRDHLSGILIGNEVHEGIGMFGKNIPVTLLVNSHERKAEFYRAALTNLGCTVSQVLEADAISLRGLQRVGQNFLKYAA